MATKEIPEEEWAEWDARYQAAASDLDNRDEKVRAWSRQHLSLSSQVQTLHIGQPCIAEGAMCAVISDIEAKVLPNVYVPMSTA